MRVKTHWKKYEELCSKIRDLIKTITNNSGNYDKKYMKIKFNSDRDLTLNKTLELPNMIIVVRSVFYEGNKCYPQVFLEVCLYKLWMLEYDRIEILEGIDVNKTNGSRECIICHYSNFLEINFIFQPEICNGCLTLMQKAMSFNDVAIVSVKGNDYRIHFWYMSKNETINSLKMLIWL